MRAAWLRILRKRLHQRSEAIKSFAHFQSRRGIRLGPNDVPPAKTVVLMLISHMHRASGKSTSSIPRVKKGNEERER